MNAIDQVLLRMDDQIPSPFQNPTTDSAETISGLIV
jgi:hypothetical protein